MVYFGCDASNETNFLRILLCYEKLEDVLKESLSIDQALFVFELKPIATQIVAKLIENNCKITSKCFAALTANEMEHLCTNNVGSHLIQECLRLFGAKERIESLGHVFDKLKVSCCCNPSTADNI